MGNWWIQSVEWLHLQAHKQLTNFSGISHSLQKNEWSIGLCRSEEFHSLQVNLVEWKKCVKTVIPSAKIYHQIFREILQHFNSGSDYVWIDLSDLDTGVFRWGDGVLASAGWTNWKNNEPNNSGGKEDCVHLYSHLGGLWNDNSCLRQLRALCERPIWWK